MIKLKLLEKPKELSIEKQQTLTKEFIDSKKTKSVWKKAYIEKSVKQLAFGKCCFSEIYLDRESTYTEIEHFYSKNLYPDKVVEWGNLLPSCKKCNTSKGDTDIAQIPIINPFVENPKDFLYFKLFRLYPKNNSQKGKNTIDILNLNDRTHFTNPRGIEASKVLDLIEGFYDDCIDSAEILKLSDLKKKNRINRIKGYLSDINRHSKFSACISTAVLQSPKFPLLKSFLETNNLWDKELENYYREMRFCFLG